MKKKLVSKLRQEVKVKVDIVTSDDIKIYNTGKFQDFTARYIIKQFCKLVKNLNHLTLNSINTNFDTSTTTSF